MSDLGSPPSFGHGGATGCTLFVDPLHGVAVAYVSNKHARADAEGFERRLAIVVNCVLAALTR